MQCRVLRQPAGENPRVFCNRPQQIRSEIELGQGGARGGFRRLRQAAGIPSMLPRDVCRYRRQDQPGARRVAPSESRRKLRPFLARARAQPSPKLVVRSVTARLTVKRLPNLPPDRCPIFARRITVVCCETAIRRNRGQSEVVICARNDVVDPNRKSLCQSSQVFGGIAASVNSHRPPLRPLTRAHHISVGSRTQDASGVNIDQVFREIGQLRHRLRPHKRSGARAPHQISRYATRSASL